MSQKERIFNMLLDKDWVCVTDMLALYVPDYRRRLCDLKDDGYMLESRPCMQHDHKSKILKEWRLVMSVPAKHIIYPKTSENSSTGLLEAKNGILQQSLL